MTTSKPPYKLRPWHICRSRSVWFLHLQWLCCTGPPTHCINPTPARCRQNIIGPATSTNCVVHCGISSVSFKTACQVTASNGELENLHRVMSTMEGWWGVCVGGRWGENPGKPYLPCMSHVGGVIHRGPAAVPQHPLAVLRHKHLLKQQQPQPRVSESSASVCLHFK